MAAGYAESDGGKRFFQPDASLRYLPQEPDLAGFETTLAYVEAGLGPLDDPYRALSAAERSRPHRRPNIRATCRAAKRGAPRIARVLAPEPDILLLDEPTNHLDLPAIEWLEKRTRQPALGARPRQPRPALPDQPVPTPPCGSTADARAASTRASPSFEAWRDQVLEEEERDRHKLDRQDRRWRRTGSATASPRAASATCAAWAELAGLRQTRREERRSLGTVKMFGQRGRDLGQARHRGQGGVQGLWRPRDRQRLLDPDRARRPARRRGRQRRRQDHAAHHADGPPRPGPGTVRLGANVALATLDQGRTSLSPNTTLADALTGGGSDRVRSTASPSM